MHHGASIAQELYAVKDLLTIKAIAEAWLFAAMVTDGLGRV
jgi:hypothetical protein